MDKKINLPAEKYSTTFMKNLILLIFVLIFGSCAIKKNTEIKDKSDFTFASITESFDAKKINYIGFKKNCIGVNRLEKATKINCRNCYSKNEIYIFWNDREKSYVQKFDNCSAFNVVIISGFKPNEFLKKNTTELQTNEVGGYKINEDTYLSTAHSCYRNFIVNDGILKFEKGFDVLDLTGENENLNYKINNSLKIVALEKILNGIILKLESQNQFKRNKKTCLKNVYN